MLLQPRPTQKPQWSETMGCGWLRVRWRQGRYGLRRWRTQLEFMQTLEFSSISCINWWLNARLLHVAICTHAALIC